MFFSSVSPCVFFFFYLRRETCFRTQKEGNSLPFLPDK